VHRARQASLGRDVAVKRVRADAGRDDAAADLLREALITGMLEHPNIVPVHDLALAEDGRPLLVMKRIEGRGWDERLRDRPDGGTTDFRDWLELQLRVLIDVCDAVRFAHARGIVHRDIKPENVMLGEFGEVLLVDWGVAVSTRSAHRGRLPLAADSRHIAGTPAYMSPEQVTADADALGERTDVYLLGAVLHELLAGRPPHDFDNANTALFSAYTSAPPAFPDCIAEPLAAICRKAMAREPADRHGNATELRDALARFLSHRASIEITERALAQSEELHATAPADDLDGLTRVDPQGVHKLFTRCRFGYQQALDIWPGNTRARDGLQRILLLMIGRSIDAGQLTQAALLAEELPTRDPAVLSRIRTARAAQRERDQAQRDLGRLGARHDLRVGRVQRTRITVSLTALWTLIALGTHWLYIRGELTGAINTAIAAAVCFVTLVYGVVRHEKIRRAGLNQRMFHVASLTVVAVFALRLFAWYGGLPVEVVQPGELLVFFMGMGSMAALTRRRLALTSVLYIIGAAVAARWHDTAFLVSAGAHAVAIGGAAWLLDQPGDFGRVSATGE